MCVLHLNQPPPRVLHSRLFFAQQERAERPSTTAAKSIVTSALSKSFLDPMLACTRLVLSRHLLLTVTDASADDLRDHLREAMLVSPWSARAPLPLLLTIDNFWLDRPHRAGASPRTSCPPSTTSTPSPRASPSAAAPGAPTAPASPTASPPPPWASGPPTPSTPAPAASLSLGTPCHPSSSRQRHQACALRAHACAPRP